MPPQFCTLSHPLPKETHACQESFPFVPAFRMIFHGIPAQLEAQSTFSKLKLCINNLFGQISLGMFWSLVFFSMSKCLNSYFSLNQPVCVKIPTVSETSLLCALQNLALPAHWLWITCCYGNGRVYLWLSRFLLSAVLTDLAFFPPSISLFKVMIRDLFVAAERQQAVLSGEVIVTRCVDVFVYATNRLDFRGM